MQEGFGEQRGDEIAGDEVAGAVEEEAAIGVAVPGDAGIGLLLDHLGGDIFPVLLDQRIGLVVRECAIHLEAQSRRLEGQAIEQLGRHDAGHTAAGVEHDVEGLD